VYSGLVLSSLILLTFTSLSQTGLHAVAHTFNPRYSEVMGWITVRGQTWQKVRETPSQPIKSWMQGHASVIPAMPGSINKRIAVLAFLRNKRETLFQK
jgi:hypothetical protein